MAQAPTEGQLVADLSHDEEKALAAFLSGVNSIRDLGGLAPVPAEFALPFLFARKFDAPRAIELYEGYMTLCSELDAFEINFDDVKDEIATGKLLIPCTFDAEGAAVVCFLSRKHVPGERDPNVVLRAVLYQLNFLLQRVDVMRGGITFVYDMTDAGWANFDYHLSESILRILQDSYPARLRALYVFQSPWWVSTAITVLKSFMKRKLAEKVLLVNDLSEYIPRDCLPAQVGGTDSHDHSALFRVLAESSRTVFSVANAPKKAAAPAAATAAPVARPQPAVSPAAAPAGAPPKVAFDFSQPLPPIPPRPTLSAPVAREDLNMGFFKRIREQGRLKSEYKKLEAERSDATYLNAYKMANKAKNRYGDVLPPDHTRVVLSGPEGSDYINANYISVGSDEKAYVATQGPLETTAGDFWRMIWEINSAMVVMVTKCVEGRRTKCHQYWPDHGSGKMEVEGFHITTVAEKEEGDAHIRTLDVVNAKTGEKRTVEQVHYQGWPDHGVPASADNLIRLVRHAQAHRATHKGQPIVLHCSAGIGRTGTFIAIDAALQSLKDGAASVDLPAIVSKMRKQRSGMVQTVDQYEFSYQAIMRAIELGL